MKKKELFNFLVCVGFSTYVSLDIWATDCDIIKSKNCVYFWNNDEKVAFFELSDIVEICKIWDSECDDLQILYSRKGA